MLAGDLEDLLMHRALRDFRKSIDPIMTHMFKKYCAPVVASWSTSKQTNMPHTRWGCALLARYYDGVTPAEYRKRKERKRRRMARKNQDKALDK